MSEDELKAIQGGRPLDDEVRMFADEVRRLRGLVDGAHDQGSNAHNEPACPWYCGEQRRWPAWDCVGRRPIEHAHDCPAFTPDGAVR